MAKGKVRADHLAVMRGLAESRERAKRLIMAGEVYVTTPGGRERVAKPGQELPEDSILSLAAAERFVSRGGEKLATALEAFAIDVAGLTALDVGASTGGFSDCLLQAGAAHVYAADVGYGQLHQKLRGDPRVTVLERVNMRLAPPDLIGERVDLLVADVSFISLTKVLPACMAFLKDTAQLIVLIKPQFELTPDKVGKGVVRDETLRKEAVDLVVGFCRETLHLALKGLVPSKILGPKGNQEYLAWFARTGTAHPHTETP